MKKHTFLSVLVVSLCLFQGGQRADAGAPISSGPDDSEEARVNRVVQTWMEAAKDLNGGDWSWLPMTSSELVRRALRENLTLKQQALTVNMAGETLKEVQARFDPVLSASASYNHSDTEEREAWGEKYKKGLTRCPQVDDKLVLDPFGSLLRLIRPGEAEYDDYDAVPLRDDDDDTSDDGWICLPKGDADYGRKIFAVFSPSSPVHYLRFDQERPEGRYWKKATASVSDPRDPTKVGQFALGLAKPLPWGADLSLSQKTVHKDPLWVLNEKTSEPIMGSYDRPWTASMDASLSLPVPGGKNFGRYATREVDIELSSLDRQRAQSDYQSGEIALIQDAQNAFWSLVRGVRVLEATIKNRRTVGRLLRQTRNLFDLQRVTSYEMLQVRSEYARVKNHEVVAWNDYVSASNTLNLLLNLPQQVLFLPLDYRRALAELSNRDLGDALQAGSQQNPGLQSQAVAVQKVGLRVKKEENQAQPDLSMNVSISAKQSNGLYGYEGLGEALAHLPDPDQLALSGRMAFRYPFGNRYLKARVKRVREEEGARRLDKRMAENRVSRQIKNAHITLDSALIRIAMSERHLRLTQRSYQKARRMQELRKVTEYEIIAKGGEVLEAEKRLILARVDAKKAEIDLLAAMGSLQAGSILQEDTIQGENHHE